MERIVLFDGVCVFCDAAVHWLTARDPQGLLRYAALQGGTAAELRGRHPQIPEALSILDYVARYLELHYVKGAPVLEGDCAQTTT